MKLVPHIRRQAFGSRIDPLALPILPGQAPLGDAAYEITVNDTDLHDQGAIAIFDYNCRNEPHPGWRRARHWWMRYGTLLTQLARGLMSETGERLGFALGSG